MPLCMDAEVNKHGILLKHTRITVSMVGVHRHLTGVHQHHVFTAPVWVMPPQASRCGMCRSMMAGISVVRSLVCSSGLLVFSAGETTTASQGTPQCTHVWCACQGTSTIMRCCGGWGCAVHTVESSEGPCGCRFRL